VINQLRRDALEVEHHVVRMRRDGRRLQGDRLAGGERASTGEDALGIRSDSLPPASPPALELGKPLESNRSRNWSCDSMPRDSSSVTGAGSIHGSSPTEWRSTAADQQRLT
jgi:hypothetical protein